MKRERWTWMPHPGHLIVALDCRFHLNTCVGKYIVSTVGEYLPGEGSRQIIANSRGVRLEGMGDARLADYMRKIGYEEIGYGRKYETMVFKAGKRDAKSCCQFSAAEWSELAAEGYNKPEDALAGHLKFCAKWAAK